MGAPIVELKNVNVAYGQRKVLEDVSWTIREGERWVLSGQNGVLLPIILTRWEALTREVFVRIRQEHAAVTHPR